MLGLSGVPRSPSVRRPEAAWPRTGDVALNGSAWYKQVRLSPSPAEASTWPAASLCATGQGRAHSVLNLSFVFLLAKFIASWRAGGLFKGEKRPSEA